MASSLAVQPPFTSTAVYCPTLFRSRSQYHISFVWLKTWTLPIATLNTLGDRPIFLDDNAQATYPYCVYFIL